MSSYQPTISGWDRVAMAIEEIRERMLRTASILEAAGIPYAVIGGNAVAEWVGRVEKAAVRFTRDVDILLNRADLPRAIETMEKAGFIFNETMGVPMFLDGPNSMPRDAVHILIASEKVRANDLAPSADVEQSEQAIGFTVLSLAALINMKLTSYRDKDRVHLRDMLDVGLIDKTWPSRLSEPLAERLQFLIDRHVDASTEASGGGQNNLHTELSLLSGVVDYSGLSIRN